MASVVALSKTKRINTSNNPIQATSSEIDLINAARSLNTIAMHLTCDELGLKDLGKVGLIDTVITMLSAEENFSSKTFDVADIQRYTKRANQGYFYKYLQSLVDAGFIKSKKVHNARSLTNFSYQYRFTNKAIETHLIFGRHLFALMAKDARFKDRVK